MLAQAVFGMQSCPRGRCPARQPLRRPDAFKNPLSRSLSRRPQQQLPLLPCFAVTSPGTDDITDSFSVLTRLHRQLDCAVAEENYALAAQLRDESKGVFDALSPSQQYTYHQLRTLRSSSKLEDKVKAVQGLGATGDDAAVPYLAALLADESLQSSAQSALWAIFMSCKDPTAQDALLEGTRLMGNDQLLDQARQLFDQVVKKCPTFAEGYNKRATLNYMQRRFRESISDCHTVLSIQPYHFGAASGMGLCYLQLGEYEEAVRAFDLALSIHPGLPDISRIAQSLRQSISQERAKGGGDKLQ